MLLAVYIASIVFTFFTHKHLFIFKPHEDELVINRERNGNKRDEKEQSSSQRPEIMTQWSKKKSFFLLGLSMSGVIVISEILVGSIEVVTAEFGFGELFVGTIIIGIVGNAAEHSSAILLARKGKMDLSIGIAAGSGTQIALFVVPILVICRSIIKQTV